MPKNKVSNLQNEFDNQPTEILQIFQEFAKLPELNIFRINLNYLLERSVLVSFQDDKWYQNPQKFCLDYYGNQYFYPVVLLANNIDSIFNFVPDELEQNYIFAPNVNAINKILELSIPD